MMNGSWQKWSRGKGNEAIEEERRNEMRREEEGWEQRVDKSLNTYTPFHFSPQVHSNGRREKIGHCKMKGREERGFKSADKP